MEHVPVLLDECIEALTIAKNPGGVYLDGTLGRGGHAYEIARRLSGGRLIAIDRDGAAIGEASERLREVGDRITYVRGNFADVGEILDDLGITAVDGMLFDLGTSSPQLDDAERGFSYSLCSALDMRMDRDSSLSAYEIVNEWPEAKLTEILFTWGEERYAKNIARAIVRTRADKPVRTTFDLNGIILSAIPPKARREKQHPSKRTFQAFRIAVNDELGAVQRMLDTAPDKLRIGARCCVIGFHSLEDRLVKNAFAAREKGCTCPKDFPKCVCGFVPTLKVITKKPITPGEAEIARNPRARSAKLRVAERI